MKLMALFHCKYFHIPWSKCMKFCVPLQYYSPNVANSLDGATALLMEFQYKNSIGCMQDIGPNAAEVGPAPGFINSGQGVVQIFTKKRFSRVVI